MMFQRWRWLLVLLVVLLLALACDDGQISNPPLPVGTIDQSPPPELAGEDGLLESSLLTVQEMEELLPGQEWTGSFGGRLAVTEEEEAAGLVAGLGGAWSSGASGLEITANVRLYESADAAAEQYLERSGLALTPGSGVEIEEFDSGDIGDASVSLVARTPEVYTFVLLRVDRVLADISAGPGEHEPEELQLVAQKLAEKIEAAILEEA